MGAKTLLDMNGNRKEKPKTSETFGDQLFVVDARYKLLKLLGKGTYGTVVMALDTKGTSDDGVPVAIKKVSRVWSHEVLLLRTLREVKLMKHFRGHRNVSFLSSCHWRTNTDCQSYSLGDSASTDGRVILRTNISRVRFVAGDILIGPFF